MRLPYGPQPMGVLVFFDNGRMMASLCDGRAVVPEAESPREFVAYGGHYTFDGKTLSTRVDFTSDTPRMGTDQVRGVKFSAGLLTLLPPPPPSCIRAESFFEGVMKGWRRRRQGRSGSSGGSCGGGGTHTQV